jgi:hypothetical protein
MATQEPHGFSFSESRASQEPHGLSSSESRGRKRELTLPEDYDMDEIGARKHPSPNVASKRMAEFRPQYNPPFVPAHSPLENITNRTSPASLLASQAATAGMAPAKAWNGSSTFAAQNAYVDTLRGPSMGPSASNPFAAYPSLLEALHHRQPLPSAGSPSLLEALNHRQQLPPAGSPSILEDLNRSQPLPSRAAAASRLNTSASTVGLTLEQLAVALSSTTNLTELLANQIVPDRKQELALNLYQSECSSLYQRCMLLAGYDIEDTQEKSLIFKLFAFKAWSEEGKRLEQELGRIDRLLAGGHSVSRHSF